MGCDIHLHIEHRGDRITPWRALGTWRPLGAERAAEYIERFDWVKFRRWHAEGQSPHPDVVWAARQAEAPKLDGAPIRYSGRNYSLFAALAGVRNHGITPMAEPRGMPDDVTVEVKSEWARWGPDAHSASYFTLTELALWEGWTQTFDAEVWVGEGPQPTRLSDERFERLQDTANYLGELPDLSPDAWNLSTCRWSGHPDRWRTLRYAARLDLAVGRSWWRYFADLHRVGISCGADNVRIVFWFDS